MHSVRQAVVVAQQQHPVVRVEQHDPSGLARHQPALFRSDGLPYVLDRHLAPAPAAAAFEESKLDG